MLFSLLVSRYRSARTTDVQGIARADFTEARTSLGSALEVARDLGKGARDTLEDAARHAFIDGMRLGAIVTAVLLLLGVLME